MEHHPELPHWLEREELSDLVSRLLLHASGRLNADRHSRFYRKHPHDYVVEAFQAVLDGDEELSYNGETSLCETLCLIIDARIDRDALKARHRRQHRFF